MKFIENSTTGRPALALIAIRDGKPRVDTNGKPCQRKSGEIRAIRLIAQNDVAGYNAARRELINIVSIGGGDWSKNWRIAKGAA